MRQERRRPASRKLLSTFTILQHRMCMLKARWMPEHRLREKAHARGRMIEGFPVNLILSATNRASAAGRGFSRPAFGTSNTHVSSERRTPPFSLCREPWCVLRRRSATCTRGTRGGPAARICKSTRAGTGGTRTASPPSAPPVVGEGGPLAEHFAADLTGEWPFPGVRSQLVPEVCPVPEPREASGALVGPFVGA